jgi:hypothetical protein
MTPDYNVQDEAESLAMPLAHSGATSVFGQQRSINDRVPE